MTSKEHKKHALLTKPDRGSYGRIEYGILGAPCGLIQDISAKIVDALKEDYKTLYVDADHASHDAAPNTLNHHILTDKIGYFQLDLSGEINSYDLKQQTWDVDLAIVNGNHFKGKNQIVILNSKKEESLSRKLDRLTNVELILTDDVDEPFDFLKNHLDSTSIPKISISDIEAVISFFRDKMYAAIPEVYGLVLAGGKSQRMGHDKARINYHGKSQVDHVAELLNGSVESIFFSCRADQENFWQSDYPVIIDKYPGLGPFGGILSAFREYPNNAWIVVACDLPFIDNSVIAQLIENRNPKKIATAFHNPETGFPDPLITLWEPKAYPRLLQFMAQGYSCPRKVLINSEINTLVAADPNILKNVNNPEEYEEAIKLIKG